MLDKDFFYAFVTHLMQLLHDFSLVNRKVI